MIGYLPSFSYSFRFFLGFQGEPLREWKDCSPLLPPKGETLPGRPWRCRPLAGSASATCSPKWAKSAARIDGASSTTFLFIVDLHLAVNRTRTWLPRFQVRRRAWAQAVKTGPPGRSRNQRAAVSSGQQAARCYFPRSSSAEVAKHASGRTRRSDETGSLDTNCCATVE